MGTQKNSRNETVLLGTQNMCLKLLIRKYLQFYTDKFCLSKPLPVVKSSLTFLYIFDLPKLGDPIKVKTGNAELGR